MTIQEVVMTASFTAESGDNNTDADADATVSVVEGRGAELLCVQTEAGVQVAIASGHHVALHRIAIPTKSESQARRAAPYVLEEDVAVDAQDVHVAVAPYSGHEQRLVGVVDHSKMVDWQQDLSSRAVSSSLLVPETALIPTADGELTAIDRGARVVAAYGDGLGFAIEPDMFARLIEGVCAEHKIKRVRLYSDRADSLLPTLTDIDISKMPAVTDDEYHDLLRSRAEAPPLNLLQGQYGASVSWWVLLKRWTPTLYLGAAVCAGLIVLTFVEGLSLRSQAEQLERETNAIVRSALPDVSRVVNPRAQIQMRVKSMQSSNGDVYLVMTAALFESLSQSRSGRLEALQFDASRLSLTATLSLEDYEEIETLRAAIMENGYSFQEWNSRSDGNRILSDIKVGMP